MSVCPFILDQSCQTGPVLRTYQGQQNATLPLMGIRINEQQHKSSLPSKLCPSKPASQVWPAVQHGQRWQEAQGNTYAPSMKGTQLRSSAMAANGSRRGGAAGASAAAAAASCKAGVKDGVQRSGEVVPHSACSCLADPLPVRPRLGEVNAAVDAAHTCTPSQLSLTDARATAHSARHMCWQGSTDSQAIGTGNWIGRSPACMHQTPMRVLMKVYVQEVPTGSSPLPRLPPRRRCRSGAAA